ncbi:F-box-like domain superfamily [Arabidopsis suecica]|uniref:F-box-like domain superfamily n=1 Tax=Arabidopsis suecica TaxID=45249 RepID=A0A8T2AF16_ARASU|nr:F-box-like domain superfamily [Arabidopsis suecica]
MSSSTNMAEPARNKKISSIMPNLSQLPDELLNLIFKNLEDYCFDVLHPRSVCRSWRCTFPFPCCLLRPSYSLPSFELNHQRVVTFFIHIHKIHSCTV